MLREGSKGSSAKRQSLRQQGSHAIRRSDRDSRSSPAFCWPNSAAKFATAKNTIFIGKGPASLNYYYAQRGDSPDNHYCAQRPNASTSVNLEQLLVAKCS